MKDQIILLGWNVRDIVTGFEGCVTSISFDISGCIQALVRPRMDKEGKLGDPIWVDTKRLTPMGEGPVMEQPDFHIISGGDQLPFFESKPKL